MNLHFFQPVTKLKRFFKTSSSIGTSKAHLAGLIGNRIMFCAVSHTVLSMRLQCPGHVLQEHCQIRCLAAIVNKQSMPWLGIGYNIEASISCYVTLIFSNIFISIYPLYCNSYNLCQGDFFAFNADCLIDKFHYFISIY